MRSWCERVHSLAVVVTPPCCTAAALHLWYILTARLALGAGGNVKLGEIGNSMVIPHTDRIHIQYFRSLFCSVTKI